MVGGSAARRARAKADRLAVSAPNPDGGSAGGHDPIWTASRDTPRRIAPCMTIVMACICHGGDRSPAVGDGFVAVCRNSGQIDGTSGVAGRVTSSSRSRPCRRRTTVVTPPRGRSSAPSSHHDDETRTHTREDERPRRPAFTTLSPRWSAGPHVPAWCPRRRASVAAAAPLPRGPPGVHQQRLGVCGDLLPRGGGDNSSKAVGARGVDVDGREGAEACSSVARRRQPADAR